MQAIILNIAHHRLMKTVGIKKDYKTIRSFPKTVISKQRFWCHYPRQYPSLIIQSNVNLLPILKSDCPYNLVKLPILHQLQP